MPRRSKPPYEFLLPGQDVEVRPTPPPGSQKVRVDVIGELGYFEFGICPVCVTNAADSREHLPPQAMTGRVRTMTCTPCNSLLGSRVDDEFSMWCNGALGRVEISNEKAGVRGSRRLPPTCFGRATDGRFVIVVLGEGTPAEKQILNSGEFDLLVTKLDERRYRIGALKQIYLAYCLLKRQVPYDPLSIAVRSALVAARDAPNNRSVPKSQIAADLAMSRSLLEPSDPAVALCKAFPESGKPWEGAIFARSVAIAWPSRATRTEGAPAPPCRVSPDA